jgi:hypothetical protein
MITIEQKFIITEEQAETLTVHNIELAYATQPQGPGKHLYFTELDGEVLTVKSVSPDGAYSWTEARIPDSVWGMRYTVKAAA